jgi:hypothetical protein
VNSRREFINGYEPSIILDFNVDGTIWDKIWLYDLNAPSDIPLGAFWSSGLEEYLDALEKENDDE